jgi:hypothetical protein
MNQEQEHDAKLRQTSQTGLVIGFFMILMAGLAVLAMINLWPVLESLPVSPPETIVPE